MRTGQSAETTADTIADAEHERDEALFMRACVQKVATGPEYSKNLTLDEAARAMAYVLTGRADPVQAGILLIALRMKRETDDENKGVLQAIMDATERCVAPVPELLDVADFYDGYTRGLPAAPFLPPVLAACGIPAVSHGLESVGPKFGVTHRMVLRAAGIDVDLTQQAAAQRIGDREGGWAYLDQSSFCPPLHDLVALRQRIVKRPVITTVEVLLGPLRGQRKTHLLTGYVHKAYPRIYAELARYAGFDSALIVRGVEGGVIPSLQQPAPISQYHDLGPETATEVEARSIGIERDSRAVPLPDQLPKARRKGDNIATPVDTRALALAAAEAGVEALRGKPGATYDSLVYAAALCLTHVGLCASRPEAAELARGVLDSGQALARFQAGLG